MFFQTSITVEIVSLPLVNNRSQYIHLEEWVILVEINSYKTSCVKSGSFFGNSKNTGPSYLCIIYLLYFKNSSYQQVADKYPNVNTFLLMQNIMLRYNKVYVQS